VISLLSSLRRSEAGECCRLESFRLSVGDVGSFPFCRVKVMGRMQMNDLVRISSMTLRKSSICSKVSSRVSARRHFVRNNWIRQSILYKNFGLKSGSS